MVFGNQFQGTCHNNWMANLQEMDLRTCLVVPLVPAQDDVVCMVENLHGAWSERRL